MLRRYILVLVVVCFFTRPDSTQAQTTVEKNVLAEGLYNPVGLAILPNGNLLIAEEGTGNDDLSAGVSMMLPDGTLGRLISGLPSTRDSGDLSGVPLVSVSPDGETIYLGNFNAQHLWTLPAEKATTLPELPYTPDDLGLAMEPFNDVYLINPFDMTFNADGVPVVVDASGNGVAVETTDGKTRFMHRFDRLSHPTRDELTIDPVPTGITRVGEEYYVALFGGCPYPANSGEVVAIDESRNQRLIAGNLNLPIDVALADDGTIWILEFATFKPDGSCFTGDGYRPNSGRLSRLNVDGTLSPVADDLNFPASVLPIPDGSVYLTELFDGRISHLLFDGESSQTAMSPPKLNDAALAYVEPSDPDTALQEVITYHDLQAYIGQDLREEDTELARLGQSLFFDPILSGDMNISCATCHHPAFAMGDGRVLPIGTGGVGLGEDRSFLAYIHLGEDYQGEESGEIPNPFIGALVPRNSPTIINSALLPAQFWDGRVESYALGDKVRTLENDVNALSLTDVLATQALFPVISTSEMAGATYGGESPFYIRHAITQRLAENSNYQAEFMRIMGTDDIQPTHLVQAIAAFERRFIFTTSPWDDYIAGNMDALDDQQKRGALLFYGALNPSVNCSSCHSGNLLTDLNYYNLLVPQIGSGKENGKNGREDFGRANVTFDHRDQYAFRTPSLRNVSLTAPYFHSGAYSSLEDVIRHHANIWEASATYDPASHLPSAYYSSVQSLDLSRQMHSVSPLLADGLNLTEDDIVDLVAFLESLTDPEAVDLGEFVPDSVLSGLELDPVPDHIQTRVADTTIQSGASSIVDDTLNDITTEWHFSDITPASGIAFQHGAFATELFDDPVAMMGGGLCWLDFNRDGWQDLYLVNSYAEDELSYLQESDRLPQNMLYQNVGGTFINVSVASGSNLTLRGNGCVAADFDNDGYTDIYITADGDNALLLNKGDGTFTNIAQAAGVNATEWNTSAAVADLNRDGWLDLFVGSYIDLENKVPNPTGAFPQDYYGIPDRLYLSDGVNAEGLVTFHEVTRSVGLQVDERTLGTIFSDLDNDGDLDLYLANDGQPNRLYEYQFDDSPEGFHFVDTYGTSNVNDRGSGMGVAGGDWDGDGWFDLVVTNWDTELNAIYRNQTADSAGLNFFYSTYRIGMMGLGNNMTGWGVHFADFDHDTDVDLVTINGRVPITNLTTDPELIRFYGNQLAEGTPGEFREWTELVGFEEVGTILGRGSALADFDNDGDLDLAVNSIAGQAMLLRNEAPSGNWLMVDTAQFEPGTRLEAYLPDGKSLQREVRIGSSYLASEDQRIHFGLGDNIQVDRLQIVTLDGNIILYEAVSANQIFVPEKH